MPVVVTGADEPFGRAAVEALLRAEPGVDVRATVRVRAAAWELIDLGVKTAVSDLVDPERLGAVLEDAHTLIHLAGADPAATLDLVLDAAAGTSVRRIGTLAPPAIAPAVAARLVAAGFAGLVVSATAAVAPIDVAAALVEADRARTVHGVAVRPLPGG